jgi:N-acetylmuramoyl-L-alanine amidase
MTARLLARGMLALATVLFAGLTVLAFASGAGPRRFAHAPAFTTDSHPQPAPPPAAQPPEPPAAEAAPVAAPADPQTGAPAPRRDTAGTVYPLPAAAAPISGLTARPVPASAGPRERRARAPGVRGVVVLDPGHGNGDPGAVHRGPSGEADLTEQEVTLAVAQHARDALEALGYDVYLTRRTAGVPPLGPLTHALIVTDLFSRVTLARAVGADVYVSIHANGSPYSFHEGTEVWYCGKAEHGEANRALADLLLQGMIHGFRTYGYEPVDRGLREDAEARTGGEWCPLVVTREAPAPSALVELLFMTNDDDARVLADERARRLVGRGIARAVDQFLVDRGVAPPE